MLSIRHVTVSHTADLRTLIADLSLTVSAGDKLAVIGEEGDGKSTLLKLIYDPRLTEGYVQYTGSIALPGEKPGYLPQEIPSGQRDLSCARFCQSAGACPPNETAALCARLRLDPDILRADTLVRDLSGGEKIKLQLFLILCRNPTLLLLDEPSNDLDLSALGFLENFIRAAGMPIVFISHDETLLSRTANRVLHLEQAYHKTTPRWTLSNTSYDTYMRGRSQALARQETLAQMEKRQEAAQQERFLRIQNAVDAAQKNISRGDPHGGRLLKKKMKAVKSLERRFEREKEDQTKRPNVEYALDAAFDPDVTLPAGKKVLEYALPELTAGGRILARNVRLRVTGPEKIMIIGDNGCGKTTLLRRIAFELSGRRDIRAAFMPQRYEDALDEKQTPVEYLRGGGDKERLTRARTCLGAFKFTTDEMTHVVSALSGGQKAKLLLLKMILDGADVLLLDEPTRNLSPLSAPVIREMLCSFGGAVICVSHDRLLIRDYPGRVLRLTRDGLNELPGPELQTLCGTAGETESRQ